MGPFILLLVATPWCAAGALHGNLPPDDPHYKRRLRASPRFYPKAIVGEPRDDVNNQAPEAAIKGQPHELDVDAVPARDVDSYKAKASTTMQIMGELVVRLFWFAIALAVIATIWFLVISKEDPEVIHHVHHHDHRHRPSSFVGVYHHLDSLEMEIVQFTCAVYFADVTTEPTMEIDIMRLGAMKGSSTVSYYTEDGSAVAGKEYKAIEGQVHFADGEYNKTIQVPLIDDNSWNPTMEFKVKLHQPEQCSLGKYLHTCRVKLINHHKFPSTKYRKKLATGEEGIKSIPAVGFFWEYFKLNFAHTGIAWRTILVVIMDQMKNFYLFLTLTLMLKLVDEVFNKTGDELTPEMKREKMEVAFFYGVLFIAPMFILHLWDDIKIGLDIHGHSCAFMQRSLIRRYLNFTKDAQNLVPAAAMQLGITKDTVEVAEGYVTVLEIAKLVGKVIVMTFFVFVENRSALIWVLAIPLILSLVGYLRNPELTRVTEDTGVKEENVLHLANQTTDNYSVVAEFMQRPQYNEMFWAKTEDLRSAKLKEERYKNNNRYFPKWLAPLFVGLYIIAKADEVLDGTFNLGVFLATLSVFNELCVDFQDLYVLFMTLSMAMDPLRALTLFFNLPTELPQLKSINRTRRKETQDAREEILSHTPSSGTGGFRTDHIPLKLINVGFSYPFKDEQAEDISEVPESPRMSSRLATSTSGNNTSRSSGSFRRKSRNMANAGRTVFEAVNLEVDQGKLIAVVGDQGTGRSTFLQVLGHTRFPTKGHIFIPSHLRVLHVSQEPHILDMSALRNLAFAVSVVKKGKTEPVAVETIEMIKKILTDLGGMSTTLRLIEDEVAAGAAESSVSEGSDDEVEDKEYQAPPRWWTSLSYTERVKIHLARAFVANPEVMILQRPLFHFNEEMGKRFMNTIKEHVENRGLCGPGKEDRRPRTVIFTPETKAQAKLADVVWQLQPSPNADSGGFPAQVSQVKLEDVHDNFTPRTRTAFERPRSAV